MKLFKYSLLFTALFALVTAAHAEVVGRVLMAAGDTSVIRNNRELRIFVGAPVEDQDTLKTGSASNMQVRFIDESIVSLRDQSILKIDEYKFTGKQDGVEKAFFNLLKGGFRTITGLIGKVNKTNYGVKTATATIGIRGTNFALLLCNAGSCGAAVKDGLYGGVSGGIIAATNNTGEYQFGSGDYFYASSKDSPVKKLIGPPGFFADHLAGQKRGVKPLAGKGNEQTQTGGYASDSSPNFYSVLFASVGQTPSPLQHVQEFHSTENLGQNGIPCGTSLRGSLPCTPVAVPPATGGGTITTPTLAAAFASAAPQIANSFAGFSNQIVLSGTNLIAYGDQTNFPSGNLGSGTIVETGSVATVDGGTMSWGRWQGPGLQIIGTTFPTPGNVLVDPPTGVPYVLGSAGAVVPTNGTFTYNFAGGPNPVNTSGAVGTFNGGALSVSFGAISGVISIATPLSLTVGGVGISLTTCASGCTFANSSPVTTMVLTGAGVTSNADTHFVGPQGAGIAMAGNIFSTTGAPTVAFAAAFKR